MADDFESCSFCIKMVSDSCRRTGCVRQKYLEGRLGLTSGFNWYMDQNVTPTPATPIDALLKDLRVMEWSSRRMGAQPFPGAQAMNAACCPVCYGVKPPEPQVCADYDTNVYQNMHNFHEADFGHRETCALQRAFEHYRQLLTAGASTVGEIAPKD